MEAAATFSCDAAKELVGRRGLDALLKMLVTVMHDEASPLLQSSRLHVAAPCCSPASSWRRDWCPAAKADVSCSSFHLRGSRYVQPAAVSTTSDFSAKLVHGDTTLLRCNGVAQKWFMGRTMNLQEQAQYYSTTVWVAGPGFSLLSHRKSWSRTRDQAKKSSYQLICYRRGS